MARGCRRDLVCVGAEVRFAFHGYLSSPEGEASARALDGALADLATIHIVVDSRR